MTASSGWRRRAPEKDLAPLIASLEPGTRVVAGGADHVDAQPLARALDEAGPDPLEGVVAQ